MSKVERFEDLIAWQKGHAFAARIHRVVNSGTFARDYSFRNQLWKAALSVPSNVAEGFERFGPGEFMYFLSVAKASCAEVRSDLYSAFDVGHIDEPTMNSLLAEAGECGRIIGKLRASVEARHGRGKSLSTQHSALSTTKKCSSRT
ncbi:MAG TPA: four helix bundle protein [Thermoanaerobaculia bacterium]|jgi:four helix bundle protein|nr:four helix bundle protein [Thermoanaerobaculia bacterium]